MLILAIDTTTQVCSVAVTDDQILLAEYTQNIKKTHSQRLLPLIDSALKDAGVVPTDLNALAVAAGPGSFTGVRIGVSTMRAMAQGLKIPAVGVCTLEALAGSIAIGNKELICPVLDARRNEVYTAIYKRKTSFLSDDSQISAFETILQPSALPLDELINRLMKLEGTVYFPGDGYLKFRDQLRDSLKERFGYLEPYRALNRATSVAMAARKMLIAEPENYSLYNLLPNYIRLPEAERLELEGKLKSNK